MSYRKGIFKESLCLPTMKKRKLSLSGFRRYLAISVMEKASREEFTSEILLFLSPVPVIEVVVIFTGLVSERETEAERGSLITHRRHVCKPRLTSCPEVPLPRILPLTGASSVSSRIK